VCALHPQVLLRKSEDTILAVRSPFVQISVRVVIAWSNIHTTSCKLDHIALQRAGKWANSSTLPCKSAEARNMRECLLRVLACWSTLWVNSFFQRTRNKENWLNHIFIPSIDECDLPGFQQHLKPSRTLLPTLQVSNGACHREQPQT
jgi:hypothetical protein